MGESGRGQLLGLLLDGRLHLGGAAFFGRGLLAAAPVLADVDLRQGLEPLEHPGDLRLEAGDLVLQVLRDRLRRRGEGGSDLVVQHLGELLGGAHLRQILDHGFRDVSRDESAILLRAELLLELLDGARASLDSVQDGVERPLLVVGVEGVENSQVELPGRLFVVVVDDEPIPEVVHALEEGVSRHECEEESEDLREGRRRGGGGFHKSISCAC